MKKSMLLSVGAMVFSASALAGKEEKSTVGRNCPAAARKIITDNSGGAKVEEIEKETKSKGGRTITVYEAEVKKTDGKKVEIKVREDGKLIELERN